MQQETIVMSVGGSLIVPDHIDTDFLTRLKNLVETEINTSNKRFVIIAGGGKTARRYADAAGEVTALENEDLDWLGIHATRLNAHLVRTVFRDIAHPEIITTPEKITEVPESARLIIAAGYRPGASTDLRAVQIAHLLGAKTVINLSNIDYVYTADPKTDPSAEKIEEIAWPDFRKLIPEAWDPGLSSPFDPIAAKEAESARIEVASINGLQIAELEHYLHNEPFVGTRIHA